MFHVEHTRLFAKSPVFTPKFATQIRGFRPTTYPICPTSPALPAPMRGRVSTPAIPQETGGLSPNLML
jgi:hypothetical protein